MVAQNSPYVAAHRLPLASRWGNGELISVYKIVHVFLCFGINLDLVVMLSTCVKMHLVCG